MKQNISEKIAVPKGVSVEVKNTTVQIKGLKGENVKDFIIPGVKITASNDEIMIVANKATKKEKARLYSTRAHIKNMIQGVQESYDYTLKICSGHFPMTVTLANNVLSVKNFIGEKIARTTRIPANANVKIDGTKITINSIDKEVAGKVASNIELLMKIPKRDRRVFQDGIYIVEKPGWSIDEQ